MNSFLHGPNKLQSDYYGTWQPDEAKSTFNPELGKPKSWCNRLWIVAVGKWILIALVGCAVLVAGCKTIEDGYGANKSRQDAKTERLLQEAE